MTPPTTEQLRQAMLEAMTSAVKQTDRTDLLDGLTSIFGGMSRQEIRVVLADLDEARAEEIFSLIQAAMLEVAHLQQEASTEKT